MYNYYRQGFVVGRLATMAERVFGTRADRPVSSLPGPDRSRTSARRARITLVIVGRTEAAAVARSGDGSSADDWFWMHAAPAVQRGGQRLRPRAAGAARPRGARLAEDRPGRGRDRRDRPRSPTDDWPFLYLRSPTIPAFNLRGIVMMSVVSLAILGLARAGGTVRPNGQMFFLGAGFMLLETKGVVHLALFFGSTWIVNAIVFSAILVMVLLSNLYVIAVQPRRTRLSMRCCWHRSCSTSWCRRTAFRPAQAARVVAMCTVTFP